MALPVFTQLQTKLFTYVYVKKWIARVVNSSKLEKCQHQRQNYAK